MTMHSIALHRSPLFFEIYQIPLLGRSANVMSIYQERRKNTPSFPKLIFSVPNIGIILKIHEISARIIFPSRIGKGIVFHDGLSGKHLTISDYT